MGLPGSGTTAGMGVPATISPSGRARARPPAGSAAGVPSRRAKGVEWKPAGRGLERRPGLEHVVDAPQLPHALGEVRVEVAVEDGVAGALVPVPGSAEVDLVGVAAARADALGVEVVGVVVVRVEEPLVVVQVEDVVLGPGVHVPELHEVADVAVVHVGRIVRVVGAGGLGTERRGRAVGAGGRAGLEPEVGGDVDQHGRIAHRGRGEEELLVDAVEAVVHGTDAEPVGDDLRADAARAVVHLEDVPHRVQRVGQRVGDPIHQRVRTRAGRRWRPPSRRGRPPCTRGTARGGWGARGSPWPRSRAGRWLRGNLPAGSLPVTMAFRSECTSSRPRSMLRTGSPALPSRAQTLGTGDGEEGAGLVDGLGGRAGRPGLRERERDAGRDAGRVGELERRSRRARSRPGRRRRRAEAWPGRWRSG